MNPTYLVIDIETVPLAQSMTAPYPSEERQPPANYKTDEAIAKWYAIDRKKWETERVKECSINPRLGRVLCLGTSEGTFTARTEEDEADVLRRFWILVKQSERIVTWNGAWDLRFLLIRSLSHNIVPVFPRIVIKDWFRKYATADHFDCKAVLLNWDIKVSGEGLNEWAQFLRVAGKTAGVSGAEVFGMYQQGHFSEIQAYCEQDVRTTKLIYERIQPLMDWN